MITERENSNSKLIKTKHTLQKQELFLLSLFFINEVSHLLVEFEFFASFVPFFFFHLNHTLFCFRLFLHLFPCLRIGHHRIEVSVREKSHLLFHTLLLQSVLGRVGGHQFRQHQLFGLLHLYRFQGLSALFLLSLLSFLFLESFLVLLD